MCIRDRGGTLGLEVDAIDASLAGIEIAELGGKVLGEVVTAEQGERGGVLVSILAEGIQVVAIGPTCTHTPVSYTHLDVYKRQGMAGAPRL